jgi:adenylyltransferase/sulfurtransferase
VRCTDWDVRVDEGLLARRLSDVSLVVEATDNDAARRAVNAACYRMGVPWLSAAAQGFAARLVLFDAERGSPCYACLYPAEVPGADG